MIALSFAFLAALPQEVAVPEHRFDLRALELLARANLEDFDFRTPLQEPFLNAVVPDYVRLDLTLDDDSSDVEQLWRRGVFELASHFHGERIDGRVDGHELVVQGDIGARSAVEHALWALERWLGRAWSVELAELPVEALDALPSAVLSAREVDTLLRDHPPLSAAQRIATTRRAARFQRERLTSVLSDYDVEVSMGGEGATDPQVFVVRWGSDAVVWLAPHVDGRVLVSCMWRAGEPLGEPRLSHVFGPHTPPIELAQGTGLRRIGSAWLADGGALVLAQGGEGARGPILVRLRALPAPALGVDDVEFFGLGAAVRVRYDLQFSGLREPTPSGGYEDPEDSLSVALADDESPGAAFGPRDTRSADDQESDAAALVHALRDRWASSERPAAAERLGQELIVAGAPDVLAATRAALAQRLAPYARTFVYDVRRGTLAREAAVGLVVGAELDPNATIPAALDVRFLGASAVGDALELTSVRQWLYLSDVDFEIGRGIELGDPSSSVIEAGEKLHCRALVLADGRLALAVGALRRDTPPPPYRSTEATSLRRVTRDTLAMLSTEIELPTSVPSDVALVTTVTPDRWTVLAVDPVDDPPGAVRVLVAKVSKAR